MTEFATREQALGTASVVDYVVNHQTSVPFEDESGEYDVVHVPIETPSVIGGKLAVALRLARARSGELLSAVSYHETLECDSLPLRHLTIGRYGATEGVFDGTLNANSYQVPASYLSGLESDLEPVLSRAAGQ